MASLGDLVVNVRITVDGKRRADLAREAARYRIAIARRSGVDRVRCGGGMSCERCHEHQATRRVRLVGSAAGVDVDIVREFCAACAEILCADEPIAGATSPSGPRLPLRGTDLGAIDDRSKHPDLLQENRLPPALASVTTEPLSGELATRQIVPPPLCEWHRHDLIVKQLQIPEEAREGEPSWQLWYVIASILFFQGTIVDQRFRKQGDDSIAAMNAFLADVGCPACANVALYKLVIRVLKKGFDHAAAVTKMKTSDTEVGSPGHISIRM